MPSAEIVTFKDAPNRLWFAEVAGRAGMKANGSSVAEAVGKLLMAKARHFGLTVTHDVTRDRT